MGSRKVTTPSGVKWQVGRRWISRSLPRWRGVRSKDSVEDVIDGWAIPIIDVGSFDSPVAFLAGVAVAVLLALILLPLILFGVELMIAGLLVALGISARAAFGRPWVVQATPLSGSTEALAWEVQGWRRSGKVIDEIAAGLTAGLPPNPVGDKEQG